MNCCGAERPADWTRGKEFNMGVSSNPTVYSIPESCCRSEISPQECAEGTKDLKVGSEPNKKVIYNDGCYTLIVNTINDSVCIIMIVGGVILAIQLLGLLLALILACSMNRSQRYKA